MKKTKITTIVGTRPEIIRMSEIVKLLDKSTEHRLIHTGQNPAPELNSVFFDDLKLMLNKSLNAAAPFFNVFG
jgi:UDP-N-acetylglucosamine 2-epimerase (non-hydrolysing)